MNYWNKDNFEGLKNIYELYSLKKDYIHFANYCLYRERGLKKQAFLEIEDFISSIDLMPTDKQKIIANELSALHYNNQHIHQLIVFQLKNKLLSILYEWSKHEIHSVVPFRWIGFLKNDYAYFAKALEIDPNDEISLLKMIQIEINRLDYQTHHLSESFLIGEMNDAEVSIKNINNLLTKLSESKNKIFYQKECNYYTNLIYLWREYDSQNLEIAFPDYCTTKGYKFNFPAIIYYDKN